VTGVYLKSHFNRTLRLTNHDHSQQTEHTEQTEREGERLKDKGKFTHEKGHWRKKER